MAGGALISISLISHGQGNLAKDVLSDLSTRIHEDFEIILTLNLPERSPFSPEEFPHPLKVIENPIPKGFGANHNAAFRHAKGKFFCVINPDIRMPENAFKVLLEEIVRQEAAVIAPAVLTPTGHLEDSIRRFPTPLSLAGKMFGRSDGRYPFSVGDETFAADWVAGMFMLFRADDYGRVGGFDEQFFLYYEDVDICTRLWKAGCRVLGCPRAEVVHDARRTSRHNLRYMRWHVRSMVRYLAKHWMSLPNTSKL